MSSPGSSPTWSAARTCASCYEIRATIETAAARLAAERRTEQQLSEIDAHQRRIEAASAEPLALRAAELDFHDAVVDAAQNSLLSHVGAMIRVALEAACDPPVPDTDGEEALRTRRGGSRDPGRGC